MSPHHSYSELQRTAWFAPGLWIQPFSRHLFTKLQAWCLLFPFCSSDWPRHLHMLFLLPRTLLCITWLSPTSNPVSIQMLPLSETFSATPAKVIPLPKVPSPTHRLSYLTVFSTTLAKLATFKTTWLFICILSVFLSRVILDKSKDYFHLVLSYILRAKHVLSKYWINGEKWGLKKEKSDWIPESQA